MPDFLSRFKPAEDEGIDFHDDTDDENGENDENTSSSAWGGLQPASSDHPATAASEGWE